MTTGSDSFPAEQIEGHSSFDPRPVTKRSEPTDTNQGSRLCTHCGLCCRGALHDYAFLEPDEVEAATAIGLPVLDCEQLAFALPCPKLAGTVCSIYGNRPLVCGRYRCQLLRNLEAGNLSFDDAIDKVDTAKGLAKGVEQAAERTLTLPEIRPLAVEPTPQNTVAGERARSSRGKLAATVFTVYMDRHFRNDRDRHVFEFNSL